MAKKQRSFADDSWAVWIDGEDTSTVYLNDWPNPKGKSYIDIAIRIRGIKSSHALNVYVPFVVSKDEIEDVSLRFNDTKILQATFSVACIVDYKKNEYTSEIAYNGKTVDIVHISTIDYEVKNLADGTMIRINLDALQSFLDNDEGYFVWRMPHKSLDDIFRTRVNVGNILTRISDLITTPIVSEKYGYSVRVNESRLLPEEVTRIGSFNRQKLKKAVVTMSINENYEVNDSGCYRIRRLEENLYREYLPQKYKCDDVISYQWSQSKNDNLRGHFNFYFSISKNAINGSSMTLYMIVLMIIAIMGEIVGDVAKKFLRLK